MREIIIYGAGAYAERLAKCYKKRGTCVNSFLVTKRDGVPTTVDGIPVLTVDEVNKATLLEAQILVAVNKKYHSEIKLLLGEKFGEDVASSAEFLSEADMDKKYREAFPIDERKFITSIEPVSRLFGNDRGTPIDRYYIEKYLERESGRTVNSGACLEVGEDTYSCRFFPNYTHDVLDYGKGMDLTKIDTLPKDKYDVFICTQVFHQIFDVKKAMEGAYYMLKKGGVMYATVCGNIVKLAHNDEYEHYWGFTRQSVEILAKQVFGEKIEIETYGNAAVATAFVQGVALEEFDMSLLEDKDEDFTICISLTARKE